eukprot:9478866-Pyramimonas_sp.AAC.3
MSLKGWTPACRFVLRLRRGCAGGALSKFYLKTVIRRLDILPRGSVQTSPLTPRWGIWPGRKQMSRICHQSPLGDFSCCPTVTLTGALLGTWETSDLLCKT